MKLKILTLLTGIIATSALSADVPVFEDYSLNKHTTENANTCKYVGVGMGLPHLDVNLGARKQWGFSGLDAGINGETSSTLKKHQGDASQVMGYANYLFFPKGTSDARFYLGGGASAGMKFAHKQEDRSQEFVGAANLLIGRSFNNKQFVQAKVGLPMEYDKDSNWLFNRVAGTTPTVTVSYGIGF